MSISIKRATAEESDLVAELVMELLTEIMDATGEPHFQVDAATLRAQARSLLLKGSYVVLLASNVEDFASLGFVALFEGYALYTEGVFGVIPELYIRPAFRSQGIGAMLLDQAVAYGTSQGWNRLEVTTPPLPVFTQTLAFYEKHGFSIAGGKKRKRGIHP